MSRQKKWSVIKVCHKHHSTLSRNEINFLNLNHNNSSPTKQTNWIEFCLSFTMLAVQEFFCPIFLEESAEVSISFPLIIYLLHSSISRILQMETKKRGIFPWTSVAPWVCVCGKYQDFLKFNFPTETLGALKTHLTGTGREEKLEMYFLKNLEDISINQSQLQLSQARYQVV